MEHLVEAALFIPNFCETLLGSIWEMLALTKSVHIFEMMRHFCSKKEDILCETALQNHEKDFMYILGLNDAKIESIIYLHTVLCYFKGDHMKNLSSGLGPGLHLKAAKMEEGGRD